MASPGREITVASGTFLTLKYSVYVPLAMSESEGGGSNSTGYIMLLLGVFLLMIGWGMVLGGFANSTEMFVAMMVLQVAGIVFVLFGWRIIADPSRAKAPSPPHYNEFEVVCERCEKPVPSGAANCPNCGNSIEWD
jgi:hypothetical protein